jgi:hypothetical protein
MVLEAVKVEAASFVDQKIYYLTRELAQLVFLTHH